MKQIHKKIQYIKRGKGLNFKDFIAGVKIKGKTYKTAIAKAKKITPNKLSGIERNIT